MRAVFALLAFCCAAAFALGLGIPIINHQWHVIVDYWTRFFS